MKSRVLLILAILGAGASALVISERDAANSTNSTGQACPDNTPFSCPSSTNCMITTSNNDSVICCPTSSDCVIINPIPCNLTLQSLPNSVVQSTNLTAGSLDTCGNSCCPHGYNCQGGNCILQKAASSPAASTSSAVPLILPSSTAPPTVIGTGPASDPGQQEQSSSNHQSLAIGLGVGLGLVLLASMALLYLRLLRHRRRQQEVKDSYLNPDKQYSPEFMGKTPQPPVQEMAAQHTRDVSGSSIMSTKKPDLNDISEPVWNETFNHAPLHRTDFLLRRGSVETGFEQNIKPSWSTRQKAKHSSINGKLSDGSAQDPAAQEKRRSRRRDRLTPLFSTPLRFGLPISPKPVGTTQQPTRPPRSDENLARLVTIGGKTVPQGEAVRVDNQTPPPSRGKVYTVRPRDRSQSQRRPLARENSYGARAGSSERGRGRIRDDEPIEMTPTPQPAAGHQPSEQLQRSDSNASTATFESDTSLNKGMDASSETINVLLPPPSVFQTPPPPARARPHLPTEPMPGAGDDTRRETTWSEIIQKAGWRKSEIRK